MKKTIVLALFFFTCFLKGRAQSISEQPGKNSFDIADAKIYVDKNDLELVKRSAELLQQDIEAVTGKKLIITNNLSESSPNAIIIGSVSNSYMLKRLFQQKKISDDYLKNKWEAYQVQAIAKPTNGIKHALVIAGSDRRGTAFGVFEISKMIGVSPWYWWADVPVKKMNALYISSSINFKDTPKVKYRGIFINDEAPSLSGWSKEKFGGFNHLFYAKVFELMLRLKANYLWPAMWGSAFYDDDSLNIKTADEYGIVIGTSHHEPLMRAHDEWRRYGTGKWNYDSNEVRLKYFWKEGMQRATNEKIVSIGMRGDGDEPMSRETATALLERIVKDQRQIIEEVTQKPAKETPQLWALYKEVQDYYDKGMRVPDDVTLLLCDDNWGNIRKLPKLDEKPRKGGYGIYYHFDYVGGPRNYKWINTNPIPRVWEQMHLAWEYNARQIWIVNVGDIKTMEFPISFWCDYAWNPEKIGADDLQKYTEEWSAAQFGNEYAKDIADIISKYGKYNGRRKPELLDANTYEVYNEWRKVIDDYNAILKKAEEINNKLDDKYKDAFFELVLHPVKASANLNELYYNVALNKLFADDKLIDANKYADKAKKCFIKDSLITLEYHQLHNSKWDHMMDQTHIGYTYWQQPPVNKIPEVTYISKEEAMPDQFDTTRNMTRAEYPKKQTGNIFFEEENNISIEAAHFTKAINTNGIMWKILPDLGRTGDAVTPFPVTYKEQKPGRNTPHLEYEFYTYSKDSFTVNTYFSPTLNFHNTPEGLQYAVSIDDEKPQIISINKEDKTSSGGIWNKWVSDNIIIKTTRHFINMAGKHVLKYWMVDPAVLLQKIVIDFGGMQQSYLGPPETKAE